MEFLEDFKGDDLNKFALVLYTEPPFFNYTAYNEHCILAYRYTIQNLTDLENSEGTLNYGLQSVPAITMWYMAVNSFINVLLKTACIKAGVSYLQAYSQSLGDRYLLLIKLLDIKIDEIGTHTLNSKLKDFELFYKSFGYDLFEQDKKIYSATEFSGLPNFINQTDILQAYLIAYEIFEAFRFVITGLDLMPYISLMSDDKLVFEKLNVLMQKVLMPSINDILSKHKLKTRQNLSPSIINYPISGLFKKKQVLPIFKYQSDAIYKISLIPAKTNIIDAFHSILIKKYKGKEEQYKRNFTTSDF